MLRQQLANAIETEAMENERRKLFTRLQRLLNTPTGNELVDELEGAWSPTMLFDDDPGRLAYNVGLRDAYQFLRDIQQQYDPTEE